MSDLSYLVGVEQQYQLWEQAIRDTVERVTKEQVIAALMDGDGIDLGDDYGIMSDPLGCDAFDPYTLGFVDEMGVTL